MHYEPAEVNIARLAAGLSSPKLRDFVGALHPINELADSADGFRWRLQTEDGDATAIVAFAEDVAEEVGVITNLSTWRDAESLAAFTMRHPFPSPVGDASGVVQVRDDWMCGV